MYKKGLVLTNAILASEQDEKLFNEALDYLTRYDLEVIEFYTDEEREKIRQDEDKIRQIEQRQSNRKAQGMVCGNCRFYKGKTGNFNDGRCLSSKDGVKNTTRLFESCGNHRAVYATEIHDCYKA